MLYPLLGMLIMVTLYSTMSLLDTVDDTPRYIRRDMTVSAVEPVSALRPVAAAPVLAVEPMAAVAPVAAAPVAAVAAVAPVAAVVEPVAPVAPVAAVSKREMRTMVVVLSRRSSFETRRVIRETWGSGHDNVFFAVGACCSVPPSDRVKWTCTRARATSVEDQSRWDSACVREDTKLSAEARVHSDMLRMSEVDVYRHLPQKLKFAYAWGLSHTTADWFLKTDDDSVVRIDTLEDYLSRTYDASGAVVVGRIMSGARVPRGGKWAEPHYTPSVYPKFPLGSVGHVVSRPVVSYVVANSDSLFNYQGEDVSLGIWLDESPLKSGVSWVTSKHMSNHGNCRDTGMWVMGHNIKPSTMRACFAHADERLSNHMPSDQADPSITTRNVSPLALDLPKRFDIVVKTMYASEVINNGHASDFASQVYERHLEVWNQFKEPCTFKGQADWVDASKPCIKKASAKDFTTSFQKTIQSLKETGFDNKKSMVPVTKSLFPLNGAHRIAAAIALGMNTMPVQVTSSSHAFDWDANFFVKKGFDTKYADFAMLQFLMRSPQVATLIFWPEAASHEKMAFAKKMVEDKFQLLYLKKVLLNKKGVASLVEHSYGQQGWLSSKIKMLHSTFDDDVSKKPVIVMFVIQEKQSDMNAFKFKLRKHFSLRQFKSSLHTSDFHEEAVIVGEMVLNDNSIMFMNRHEGHNCKEVSREIALRTSLKQVHPGISLHNQDIMIESGAVMSFFGLRKRTDIDVISEHGIDASILGWRDQILVEEHKIKAHGPIHGIRSTELLSNPSYFGYCYGLKFVSLEQLRRYKLKRGKLNKASRDKDWGDAKKIESFLQANSALQEPSQEPQSMLSGKVYICGYKKMATYIAENVFSDFHQAGLIHKATVSTERDIMVVGMFGGCEKDITKSFKGKRLYVNGEPTNDVEVPRGSYIIGPTADSANSLRVYFVAVVANRFKNWRDVLAPRIPHVPPKTVLYVASKCYSNREEAFRQLHNIMHVYAGGSCHGQLNENEYTHVSIPPRSSGWETAVESYSDYRFGLVLDSTKKSGFISEKILVAFMGGTVPIYFGTTEVFDIFNERAFIYYDVENPQPALDRIAYLEKNQTAYLEMFLQPILLHGAQTLERYFSLSDAVGDGKLKKRIRDMVLSPIASSDQQRLVCDPNSTPLNKLGRAIGQEWMMQDVSIGIQYPYYTADFSTQVLDHWDLSRKTVFECGGGFSTLWWASKAAVVTTVDDKMDFLCSLQKSLTLLGIDNNKYRLRHVVSQAKGHSCVDYLRQTGRKFDIIIIDNEPVTSRCNNLRHSIDYLNEGGVIIGDNWKQPSVWNPCKCCDEMEVKYDVHGYFHKNGWAAKGNYKKPAHKKGWQTVWFAPTNTIQQEFVLEDLETSTTPDSFATLPLVKPIASSVNSMRVKLPFSRNSVVVTPGIASNRWWKSVSSKKWELETFKVFNQEVQHGGVYVGFGEWVGVTGMFAMERASKSVLMEPDTNVFRELESNVGQSVHLANGPVYLDRRCISNSVSTISMKANGGSGSTIIEGLQNRDNFPTIKVDCLTLPMLFDEYGIGTASNVFVKIDTEGAESLILPSLLPWLKSSKSKPTVFVSMHGVADVTQRTKIATVLNLYSYYAVIRGRTKEPRALTGPGVDGVLCNDGVRLTFNDGTRFTEKNICSWCDYLLVVDNKRDKCRNKELDVTYPVVQKPSPARKPVTWISLSVCLDENSQIHDKAHFPYADAIVLAAQSWEVNTGSKVLVQIVSKRKDISGDPMVERLRDVNADVWHRNVLPGFSCVTSAQTLRMFAYDYADILDDDIIITADADAFPLRRAVLSPLDDTSYDAWVFQHFYSESSGYTFPMSLVALRKKGWSDLFSCAGHNTAALKHISKCLEQYALPPDLSAKKMWGFDQRVLTRVLLDQKVCSVTNKQVWETVGVSYSPFDDSTRCFHGQPANGHGRMDPTKRDWIHMMRTTTIAEVQSALALPMSPDQMAIASVDETRFNRMCATIESIILLVSEIKLWFTLKAGSLLAAVRNRGCILDRDIDIHILDREVNTWIEMLQTAINDARLGHRLRLLVWGQKYAAPDYPIMNPKTKTRENRDPWYTGASGTKAGIPFRLMVIGKDGKMVDQPHVDFYSGRELSPPPRELCRFGSVDTWCPTEATKVLIKRYGKSWRIPNFDNFPMTKLIFENAPQTYFDNLALPAPPMRKPLTWFLTYGNSKFAASKKRIAKEAVESGWFDDVIVLGPENLNEAFRTQYADILEKPRIGGYGVWRHTIIMETISKMNDGDFLIYIDAGCTINTAGKPRFDEYLEMLKASDYDIISMQLSSKEYQYTNSRIFEFFNISKTSPIFNSEQLASGILIMQKGKHLTQFINGVESALQFDRWLFSDNYNEETKKIESRFKDNRHEQSVMSVVRKTIGSIVIRDETWSTDGFKSSWPFWATRIRG